MTDDDACILREELDRIGPIDGVSKSGNVETSKSSLMEATVVYLGVPVGRASTSDMVRLRLLVKSKKTEEFKFF